MKRISKYLAIPVLPLLGACTSELAVKVDILDPQYVGSMTDSARVNAAAARLLAGDTSDRARAAAEIVGRHVALMKKCDLGVAARLEKEAQAAPAGQQRTALEESRDEHLKRAAPAGVASRRTSTEKYVMPKLQEADRDAQNEILVSPDNAAAAIARRSIRYAETTKEISDATCTVNSTDSMLAAKIVSVVAAEIGVEAEKEKIASAAARIGGGNMKTLFGSQGVSLIDSPSAYPVANLPANSPYWKPYNYAFSGAEFGNADLVIKLNETAQFTVKGFVFDASKTASLVSRVGVSTMGILASAAGVPINLQPKTGNSKEASLGIGATASLNAADKILAQETARGTAYRAAMRAIAATILSQSSTLGTDETARVAVRAAYNAYKDSWRPEKKQEQE